MKVGRDLVYSGKQQLLPRSPPKQRRDPGLSEYSRCDKPCSVFLG
jgi:hypothetical protein